MKKNQITYSLNELLSIAKLLKEQLKNHEVITFAGPLGAGKTTLIKELLRQCGISQTVTSPTFTYLNQYENSAGQMFYHFDLYRVASLDEFCASGFDEYLYEPESYALIEWPEHIMSLLTHHVCHVQLDYHEDQNKRTITIECKQ